MADRLLGKTALVTGGSRGIGRAIAEAFANEGCQLFLNARDPDRLADTAAEIVQQYGVHVDYAACDVTDGDGVRRMVAEAEERTPIDILVNNAGIHIPSSFVDYSFDDFKAVIESNVYSVFHVTQAVLPAMMERKRGSVVLVRRDRRRSRCRGFRRSLHALHHEYLLYRGYRRAHVETLLVSALRHA